jgi:hypothetical protein
MHQFYIADSDENSLSRCRESQRTGKPDTWTGITVDGSIGAFTGTVQSIDDDSGRGAGRRYRITVRDPNPATQHFKPGQ